MLPSSESGHVAESAPAGALSHQAAGAQAPEIRAVGRRHPGRWITGAIVIYVAITLAQSFVENPNYEWDVVAEWFTAPRILAGLASTFLLTAIAMAVSMALGVVLAVMRLSPNPLLSGASWVYVWFFRGTPLLVQLIFWYNLAALYPQIGIGLPFGGPGISVSTNDAITPFTAAILALGLNESAYMAEIVRSGILAVDAGQTQAAAALGLTRLETIRLIVLPQAMRVIIPPTGNEVISMLKTTSLVSIISYTELMYAGQLIYAVNFKTIPLLITVSIWYLIVTSVLMVVQSRIERRFGRGSASTSAGSRGAQLWRLLRIREPRVSPSAQETLP